MNRKHCLILINEIVKPSHPIVEETSIADCNDIDSLSLLNIFIELQKINKNISIMDLIKCHKIGEIINLFVHSSNK